MDYPTSDYGRVADLETALAFADNADPRTPCVLVLDTSGSMGGAPLAELNAGLRIFQQELRADPLLRRRVVVAVVTFGGALRVVPTLQARGATPLGAELNRAPQTGSAIYRELLGPLPGELARKTP